MKAGDRIRVQHYMMGHRAYTEDFTVEEFRYCLGFFESNEHRQASKFTPFCDLYERGPESKDSYISNFGEHYTNPYTLMATMGRNVQLHLVVGLLLFFGYMVAVLADAVTDSPPAILT